MKEEVLVQLRMDMEQNTQKVESKLEKVTEHIQEMSKDINMIKELTSGIVFSYHSFSKIIHANL